MRWGRFYRDTVTGYLSAKRPAEGILTVLNGAVGLASLMVVVEFGLVLAAWYAWLDVLNGPNTVWVFAILVAGLTSPSIAIVLWASACGASVRWARRRSKGHDSEALGAKGRLLLEQPRNVILWTTLGYAVPAAVVYGWLLTTFP